VFANRIRPDRSVLPVCPAIQHSSRMRLPICRIDLYRHDNNGMCQECTSTDFIMAYLYVALLIFTFVCFLWISDTTMIHVV